MSSCSLFVLSELPRSRLSLTGLAEGREAVSGSVGSFLLILEQLAKRGHSVALLLMSVDELVDRSFPVFSDPIEARMWLGNGRAIWCSWGEDLLSGLNGAGIRAIKWLQTSIETTDLRDLEQGRLNGILVVSDQARLTSLHSMAYRKIGRVYNPLNPFFAGPVRGTSQRFNSKRVVYTGYLGETKGAHLVLQAWLWIRELVPDAILVLVGSAQLYGQARALGSFGVADPGFEEEYLKPLVSRFGSFENCGIELAGLLTPEALIDRYASCALGVVNLNWSGYLETFCCTAVEMLASGLPVASVARGALPETIGKSGGAILFNSPDPRIIAEKVAKLLKDPQRLQAIATQGRNYVCKHYQIDRIVDQWEHILESDPERLDSVSGPWNGERNLRYAIERVVGRLGCGRLFELMKDRFGRTTT